MKAIIIDDEKHCCKTLSWLLSEYCHEVDLVGVAQNGAEGLELIRQLQPQLVFLDIEMPILNGIDMLLQLEVIDFDVIFTTAYNQYAIHAIKLNALDYLLKPIDKDELIAAVHKAKVKTQRIQKQQIVQFQEVQRTKITSKIALSLATGLVFVELGDLIRLEADGSYTNFILKGKKSILLSKRIGDVAELLQGNSDFFRAHKSHLINLRYVTQYLRGDGGEIIMDDGAAISLSRNKKEEFLDLFSKI